MCRHLAYLGRPTSLADVLLEPVHSLLHQTWAPADMRGSGSVNADGFGVGWYDGKGDLVRYRRGTPMWADESFPDLARSTRTSALLAAVRYGTVGMPVTEAACAPFRQGRWLFSHNGVVDGWPSTVEGLAAELPTADLMTLESPTDSALVWALVRRRLLGGEGLESTVEAVTAAVAAAAPGSRVNLLATDGGTVVASTWGHSLSVLERSDHVLVSSEPFGDQADDWRPVPDRHLVVATAAGVKISPLTQEGPLA